MKTQEFRRRRESLGLTQSQLGVLLGVNYQTISRYETGLIGIPKMAELALFYIESQAGKQK